MEELSHTKSNIVRYPVSLKKGCFEDGMMSDKEDDSSNVWIAPVRYHGHARRRPSMYVGSTDMWGLEYYLFEIVRVLLQHKLTYLSLRQYDGFELTSDADVESLTLIGHLNPYSMTEARFWFENVDERRACTARIVLCELSESLSITLRHPTLTEVITFVQGDLVSRLPSDQHNEQTGVTLRFNPDPSIFSVTEITREAVVDFFREMSFLHKGVEFPLFVGNEQHLIVAPRGLADLFDLRSPAYQLLHEPIQICGEVGSLSLEMVFAVHRGSEEDIHCYMNKRVFPEGGTHIEGLRRGIDRLKSQGIPSAKSEWGIVVAVSMLYPKVEYNSTRSRVTNVELVGMVSDLVVREVRRYLDTRPAIRDALRAG